MSGDHDLWYVKTTDGDVDRMTLDQLDEAFNAGRIDENATVLPAGESRWVRLGTLLGLDQPATPSPVSFAPMPNSMRPVSIDLSDDDPEFAQLHKKSRKGVGIAVAAALLLVPAGLLGANRMHVHLGGFSSDATQNAAAAVQAPAPVTAAPPPPAADPAPAPPPATTAAATASDENRLTDDQKAKLAAADKALESKMKARHKARSYSGGHHGSPKYKSQGFTSGGNKYDPLNSGI